MKYYERNSAVGLLNINISVEWHLFKWINEAPGPLTTTSPSLRAYKYQVVHVPGTLTYIKNM